MTPEAHHDALMDEIDYEVNTYGVESLADLISNVLSARCDEEYTTPEKAKFYTAAMKAYEAFAHQLAAIKRPFPLPDTFIPGADEDSAEGVPAASDWQGDSNPYHEATTAPCPVASPDGYECDGVQGHEGPHWIDLEPEDDLDSGRREWNTMKPYTLVGVFLDHPSAVAETFVQHVEAEEPQQARCVKDEDRPWSIVAVFDGHVTAAYVERLV
jgi:hypothetical protein